MSGLSAIVRIYCLKLIYSLLLCYDIPCRFLSMGIKVWELYIEHVSVVFLLFSFNAVGDNCSVNFQQPHLAIELAEFVF